ncbi:L7Ae/L30e/S12e/Gadd45 family ribosomal protein [Eggerthia catenaformis]
MLNKQIYNTLGLAVRAKCLVTGENVLVGIRNKSIKLVIIANDASENTKKRMINKCNYYQVEYILFSDSDSLSQAIGKSNRMAIGITEKGFANKLINSLRGLSDGKEEQKEISEYKESEQLK